LLNCEIFRIHNSEESRAGVHLSPGRAKQRQPPGQRIVPGAYGAGGIVSMISINQGSVMEYRFCHGFRDGNRPYQRYAVETFMGMV